MKTAPQRPPARGLTRTVPLRRYTPLRRQRPAPRPVATLQPLCPSESSTAPAPVPLVVQDRRLVIDRRFAQLPAPWPRGRIEDPAYLQHIRTLTCCRCGPDEQRSQTEAAHFGPRPTGRKTHDWFVNALCRSCHRYFHRWGILRGFATVAEAVAFLLAEQLRRLLERFAGVLRDDADRWYRLGTLANTMPAAEQQVHHLRQVLDLLARQLWLLTRLSGGCP